MWCEVGVMEAFTSFCTVARTNSPGGMGGSLPGLRQRTKANRCDYPFELKQDVGPHHAVPHSAKFTVRRVGRSNCCICIRTRKDKWGVGLLTGIA